MYIRRKNAEHGRLKRSVKRSKVSDVFSSSYAQYLKLLLIWAFLITMDFLLEFRFEYFWPCWLLIRSLHDSFKYQGLIFSLFFLCIALTSDFICYLFIPVTWLFFLGSTYVWVQLIWHTERGVCLPTVALCFLFMYIEFAVRLREPRNLPFNIDLCRPFASHCIGYPVVTLGFGFKSYISYKFRLRKQKEVQSENAFYFNLLDESLPEECRPSNLKLPEQPEEPLIPDIGRRTFMDGPQDESEFFEQPQDTSLTNDTSENNSPKPSVVRKSALNNTSSSASVAGTGHPSPKCNGLPSVTSSIPHNPSAPSTSNPFSKKSSGSSASILQSVSQSPIGPSMPNGTASGPDGNHLSGAGDSHFIGTSAISSSSFSTNGSVPMLPTGGGGKSGTKGGSRGGQVKDEYTVRLENDVKKLKSELQSSRSCEAELRTQLSQMAQTERLTRMELQQAKQESDGLQNRVNNLVQRIQTDKASVQLMERRLADERKQKQLAESQLAAEKKARREDQEMLAQQMAAKTECTEACKNRRRELELEARTLRREFAQQEERLQGVEAESSQAELLREERRRLSENNISMREENLHLVRSLKEENRIKQDLIAAYHGAMKDVTHLNSTLADREYDILNLNMKLSMCNYGSSPGQQQHSLQLQGAGGGGGHDTRTDNSSSPLLSDVLYSNNHRALSPQGNGMHPSSIQSNNAGHDMYNSGHM